MPHSHIPSLIRPINHSDFDQWLPLWEGYNAFYGRQGSTALPMEITLATWQRFLSADEPVHALVAEQAGQLVGLTHFLYHRSTTRIELTCYLQDLFTHPAVRGQGVGRALIAGVSQAARAAGLKRVYWQTHINNAPGRQLYDKVAQHAGFIIYGQDF